MGERAALRRSIPHERFRLSGGRGACFGSIHRTLNHLLVADPIWLTRFRAAREMEDAGIERWVDGLSDEALAAPLSYQTLSRPAPIKQPLGAVLTHVFNHQTHHRGQIHALMPGLEGRDFAPSLDLILYQRETGVEMS